MIEGGIIGYDTNIRSGGNGGQHQNKTESGVRCKHPESGAVGECRNFRHQHQNKVEAFKRMANSQVFQSWRRRKARETLDKENKLENLVAEAMKEENIKIEYGPFDNLQKWDG
jgi:peptide chain release factor 1